MRILHIIGVSCLAAFCTLIGLTSSPKKADAQIIYYTHTVPAASCVRCVGAGCGNASPTTPTNLGTWANTDANNYLTVLCPIPLGAGEILNGASINVEYSGVPTWGTSGGHNISVEATMCASSATGVQTCGATTKGTGNAGTTGNLTVDFTQYNPAAGWSNYITVYLAPTNGGGSTGVLFNYEIGMNTP